MGEDTNMKRKIRKAKKLGLLDMKVVNKFQGVSLYKFWIFLHLHQFYNPSILPQMTLA